MSAPNYLLDGVNSHPLSDDISMRQSESARMTTAQEAAFRVQYPNSTPRSLKVIALDPEAGKVVSELSTKTWNRAIFFNSLSFPKVDNSGSGGSTPSGEDGSKSSKVPIKDRLNAWLKDVSGHASELVAEIDSATRRRRS